MNRIIIRILIGHLYVAKPGMHRVNSSELSGSNLNSLRSNVCKDHVPDFSSSFLVVIGGILGPALPLLLIISELIGNFNFSFF